MNFSPNNITVINGKISSTGMDSVQASGGKSYLRRWIKINENKHLVNSLEDYNTDDYVVFAIDKDDNILWAYNKTQQKAITTLIGSFFSQTQFLGWLVLGALCIYCIGGIHLTHIPAQYHFVTYIGLLIALNIMLVDVITDYWAIVIGQNKVAKMLNYQEKR